MNQQVKRNLKRFPEDFMFQLTTEEKAEVATKCDHLKTLKYPPQLPYVFTEHGAVMLASVLNSDRAIEVNIQIVRIFTKMREIMLNRSHCGRFGNSRARTAKPGSFLASPRS